MNHKLLLGVGLFCCAVGCGEPKKPATLPLPNTTSATSTANTETKPTGAANTSAIPNAAQSRPVEPSSAKTSTAASTASEPVADAPEAKQWVAQLAGADEQSRTQAEEALLEAGKAAVPALLVGLQDRSPEIRRAVAYFLLEKFPPTDGRVGSALRDSLGDEDRKVRQLALQAVKRMPPDAIVPAVSKIAQLLDSTREEPINRADAARLLAKLGSEAREALPALIQAASADRSEKVRAAALYSVSKIAEPREALPVLVKSLGSDPDTSVRVVAAASLGKLGPGAATASTELASALDDRDEKVRRAAADALVAQQAAAVLPLVGKLDAKNPRTRELALFTLGRLGTLARPAAAAIEKLTKDEDESVRELAGRVLESLRGM